MAYLTAEEEMMLQKVDDFLSAFLTMPNFTDAIVEDKKTINSFTEWLEKSCEYSKNARMKSAERVKEKRKTNPRYCRESREKNLEYQKKSRAKKRGDV